MGERLHLISQHISLIQPQKQTREQFLLANSKLDTQQLYRLIFSDNYKQDVDSVYNFIRQNKSLFVHPDIEDQDRPTQRQFAAKQMLVLLKFLKIDVQNDFEGLMGKFYAVATHSPGLAVKTFLHYTLYIASILLFSQEDEPQHKIFLNRAKEFKDLGCFGLTQYHHGSYSRGIVTEAIYQHQQKSFILDSKGTNGMKFWIGAASQMANSSVIWAQLIVKGVSYGPHCFVVPLRDQSNHDLLPGVKIGDCGSKIGLNNIDNGFIILQKVRIPKQNLLGKLGHVNSEGNYISNVKSNNNRFGRHMSPLSAGRAMLSQSTLGVSLGALTIAYRYITNRRQFTNPSTGKEELIIDYPTSKYRIMPLIASTISYLFGCYEITKLYRVHRQILTDPDNAITNQLHAISGMSKAKASWLSNKIITECRQLMGGHGFSSFSRIGVIYTDNDVNNTWEGDNHLLLQQTSKFILKNAHQSAQNIINLTFINEDLQSKIPTKFDDNILSMELLQLFLKIRVKTAFNRAVNKMGELKAKGLSNYQIWNASQPYYCNELSLAFGDYYYLVIAKRAEKKAQQKYNAQLIRNCLRLWILTTLEKQRFLSNQFRVVARRKIVQLCEMIYQQSGGIMKVIGIPSDVIGSPFANENGQGMKQYINTLFSAKNTFRRVDWFEEFIQLRDGDNK